jgi:sigma-B regulation protein RsbU (phosphoserine phosphatase)
VIGIGVILSLTSIILATAYLKRRKQVHEYQQSAVQELQDAREMQISLLPESAPSVAGMEIAGKSVTANTVGGDFFDYLTMQDGKLGIAIADVSGKGLRAAMNANLASGMLDEVAITESSCGRILSRLNAHLYSRMEKQMFTAFSFAILDEDILQWSNAAQPLPLIKRGSAASEVIEDGQLPLGMVPDVEYPDYQLKLQSGDIVIFYTDGIIEAENEAREIYGTERLLDLVAGIDPEVSADDVIDVILQDVNQFVGGAERYDDMTIVVVNKLA